MKSPLPDQASRDQAIRERRRNVLVEASAGTGKTSLVISRLLELLAPKDGSDPIPMHRIAAITFTRKAAGELRVRTRQQLLQAVTDLPPDAPLARPLLAALGDIDTAHIGTIHGFAHSLLRMWPAQAQLPPHFEPLEDFSALAHECFETLLHAAEQGTLADLLEGDSSAALASEATETIRDAQRASLRLESVEGEFWTRHGLDALFSRFIETRDCDISLPKLIDFERTTFDRFTDEFLSLTATLSASSRGARWLIDCATLLRALRMETAPSVLYREVVDRFERGPLGRRSKKPSRAFDFADDAIAWDTWKAFDGDTRQDPVRLGSLRDDLLAPLRRWMAVRLVRLQPAVLQVYERIKRRHGAADQIDLLLRLRNLLRDDRQVRAACQRMFDHVFVDEFQDTDPLQAEIVLFLCERGASATSSNAVQLEPGKLTIVGDPKQSIYRFRRADIANYRSVCEQVRRSPCLSIELTASLRTAPALVEWVNDRFTEILGPSEQGETFRGNGADVFYKNLTPGRQDGSAETLHVVPFETPADRRDVLAYRQLEADTMARYLRWLTGPSGRRILDPWTNEPREVRYGDIGVLAVVTTTLPLLFSALDREGVPYSARGGSLFLRDHLHRQFLLGLCAIADPDDGVAAAALLRPPFFAIDFADLARFRPDHVLDPVREAKLIVDDIRGRRFERSPGATARALLDQTGFGRLTAFGSNGLQRLASLRELCFQVEMHASAEGLDFEATIESLRSWITSPVGLDPPHPVGSEAIQVLTVHQAKGLEFPVVVFWDGCCTWNERLQSDAWDVDRGGRGWSIRLDGLRWETPPDLELAEREKTMREAERRRLIYVAATRARDLLVLPRAGAGKDTTVTGKLLLKRLPTTKELSLHSTAAPADWFASVPEPAPRTPQGVSTDDERIARAWDLKAATALTARARPRSVTAAALGGPRAIEAPRSGRFGHVFGETVHRAIGHALRGQLQAPEAVRRAASATGLQDHLSEAAEDVERAIRALEADSLVGDGANVAFEYPVAQLTADGGLLYGYVDLLAQVRNEWLMLDFKTDAAPASPDSVARAHVEQLSLYKRMLPSSIDPSHVKMGLLYTADGVIRWIANRAS